MCAESLRYFDIFKQVYLLGFVSLNESALFDPYNLRDPYFVNSYLIFLAHFKLFPQIVLILI